MTTAANIKRIVCLANSRKPSGRCIAGKELLPGSWVRPVKGPEGEGLRKERLYAGGNEPRVLDVIDVPVLNAKPENYQRENWLCDTGRRWRRVSRLAPNRLMQLVDVAEPLWIDGYNTNTGQNDRIPVGLASSLGSSLRLIKVEQLKFDIYEYYGWKMDGTFRHNGTDYRLRVTDPVYEEQYMKRSDGSYSINGCCLTISLGGPYHGYAYKLIAAIIKP